MTWPPLIECLNQDFFLLCLQLCSVQADEITYQITADLTEIDTIHINHITLAKSFQQHLMFFLIIREHNHFSLLK